MIDYNNIIISKKFAKNFRQSVPKQGKEVGKEKHYQLQTCFALHADAKKRLQHSCFSVDFAKFLRKRII